MKSSLGGWGSRNTNETLGLITHPSQQVRKHLIAPQAILEFATQLLPMAASVNEVTSVQSHSEVSSYTTTFLALLGFTFIILKVFSLVRLFFSLFVVPGLPVRLSHDFSHSRIASYPVEHD